MAAIWVLASYRAFLVVSRISRASSSASSARAAGVSVRSSSAPPALTRTATSPLGEVAFPPTSRRWASAFLACAAISAIRSLYRASHCSGSIVFPSGDHGQLMEPRADFAVPQRVDAHPAVRGAVHLHAAARAVQPGQFRPRADPGPAGGPELAGAGQLGQHVADGL